MKGQRRSLAINETVTWLDYDGSFTGCVVDGVSMLQGNAKNFLLVLSMLDFGIRGSCVNVFSQNWKIRRVRNGLPSG